MGDNHIFVVQEYKHQNSDIYKIRHTTLGLSEILKEKNKGNKIIVYSRCSYYSTKNNIINEMKNKLRICNRGNNYYYGNPDTILEIFNNNSNSVNYNHNFNNLLKIYIPINNHNSTCDYRHELYMLMQKHLHCCDGNGNYKWTGTNLMGECLKHKKNYNKT